MKHSPHLLLLALSALSCTTDLVAQANGQPPMRGAFAAMSSAIITDDPVNNDSVLKIRYADPLGVTIIDYPAPPNSSIPDFRIAKLEELLALDIKTKLNLASVPNLQMQIDGISTRNDQIPVSWDNGVFRVQNVPLWSATNVGVAKGPNGMAGSYLASLGQDTGFEVLSYYGENAPVYGHLGGEVYLEESRTDMDSQPLPQSQQLMAYDSFIPQIYWNNGAPSSPLMPFAHYVHFTLTKSSADALRAAHAGYRLKGRKIWGSTVFTATWHPGTQCWRNLSILVDHNDLGYTSEVDIDAIAVAEVTEQLHNLGINIPQGETILTYSLTRATTPVGEDQLMVSAMVQGGPQGPTRRRGPLVTRSGTKVSDRIRFLAQSDAKLICHKDPESGASAPMVGLPAAASAATGHFSLYRPTPTSPIVNAVVSAQSMVGSIFFVRVHVILGGSSYYFDTPIFPSNKKNYHRFTVPALPPGTSSLVTAFATIYTLSGTDTTYPLKIKM